MLSQTPARNDQIRAFIFMNGADVVNPDPIYYPCLGVEAAKRSRGDIKIVECPDPLRYGEYKQVDGIPGQVGRWTSTLMTRLFVGEESPLEVLNNQTCAFDLHLNRGLCEVATDMSQFAEMEIWEDVRITNYTTSALQALSSDQRESSTESVDVSFRVRQKVFNLAYALMTAPSETGGVPLAVEFVPSWCCNIQACQVAFMLTDGALHYTFDGGLTFTEDTPGTGTPGAGFRVGSRYVVVLSNYGTKVYSFGANGITSTLETEIDGLTDVQAGASNGLYGLFAEGLKLYRVNPTGIVMSVFDATGFAGGATEIKKISIDPAGAAVVGFDNGEVMYSKDGYNWLQATVLPGADMVTGLQAKSANNWVIGTTSGKVYVTDNSGLTWTKTFDNGIGDNISAIKNIGNHVVYMASGVSLYRSVDGGFTWTIEPSDPGRPFITVTSIADIGVCPDNMNRLILGVVAGGNARVAVGTPV